MTTYSLTLDDLDLALLPVRSRAYNDFLKQEYYEFQVMKEETTEEPLIYICHICAIDVPAAFMNEHCASVKHQANVRISTEASRRMCAFVTAHPLPLTPFPVGRFCESCATVVGIDHDKTKEHRVAVIHDRMLSDLMKVYVGDDDFKNGDRGSEHKRLTGEDNKADSGDIRRVENEVATPKVETAKTQVAKTESKVENQVQNGQATASNEYATIDTETYIKLLNNRNIPDYPKIVLRPAGDKIQILVNGDIINVSNDNFHSYHRLEGKIQCRACCETLIPTEEEMHKLSLVHIKRVGRAVEDSHCIREIYENWSHCILCNQVIKNTAVNAHTHTEIHANRKRDASVFHVRPINNSVEKASMAQDTQQAGSSGIGGIMMPNQNTTTLSTGKVEHQPKVSTIPSRNDIPPLDPVVYPFKCTEQRNNVFCVICNCLVPITNSNRKSHLKGMRHAYSMKHAKK